jgi:hypothetical protein
VSRFKKAFAYVEIAYEKNGALNRMHIPVIKHKFRYGIQYRTQHGQRFSPPSRFAKPVLRVLRFGQTPNPTPNTILHIDRLWIKEEAELPKGVQLVHKLATAYGLKILTIKIKKL